MARLIDLTGKKYSRLTVIGRIENNPWGKPMWLCKCDCGNETKVTGDRIRSNWTKSCGCLKKEPRREESRELAMLKNQYTKLKDRHKNKLKKIRGIIDFNTFKTISFGKCNYCGLEHSREVKDYKGGKESGLLTNETLLINGIDRIDSNIGCTKDNCVSCCTTCNIAKNAMSKDVFLAWIKLVYNYNFSLDNKTI